jgi:hypothetical protein
MTVLERRAECPRQPRNGRSAAFQEVAAWSRLAFPPPPPVPFPPPCVATPLRCAGTPRTTPSAPLSPPPPPPCIAPFPSPPSLHLHIGGSPKANRRLSLQQGHRHIACVRTSERTTSTYFLPASGTPHDALAWLFAGFRACEGGATFATGIGVCL